MKTSGALLRAKQLTAGYGRNKIISDIEFEFYHGEIVAVMGPNGAGKSTLLRTFAGLLPPLSGEAFLDGENIYEKGRNTLKRNGKKLSILTTSRVEAELMTVREVIESGRYIYSGVFGGMSDMDRVATDEVISLIGLEELEKHPFSKLSDGQKQRVMLGRAICKEPELLIMDEPLTFLDLKFKHDLTKLLRRLAAGRNMGILISLHEPEAVRNLADKVLTVKDGRMKNFFDNTDELNDDYINELFGLNEK